MRAGSLTLMTVHAHPDDETSSSGGVIAQASARGIHTVLVTVTRGEEGEILDPDLDAAEARHRLGAIREVELRRAATILGVAELFFLGYRDSGMAGTPENANPHNFQNADPDEATGRLVRIIRQTRPDVIITYDERGGYGHPDHIAAHRTTLAAFDAAGDPARFAELGLPVWQPRKLYYSVFTQSTFRQLIELFQRYGTGGEPAPVEQDISAFTVPDDAVTARVDVRSYVLQKQAAFRAHRTQIGADNALISAPEDAVQAVLGLETFIRARSLVPTPQVEDDLFTGLDHSLPAHDYELAGAR
ncbi:MAG TPA: PIG-L family deacetylase [Chloroflexota bacterium]